MNTDRRADVIADVLGSIANDHLPRLARRSDTDADAAQAIKRALDFAGSVSEAGAWQTCPRGIAYNGPGEGVIPDPADGADVIPWKEVARAARSDAEQLTLI